MYSCQYSDASCDVYIFLKRRTLRNRMCSKILGWTSLGLYTSHVEVCPLCPVVLSVPFPPLLLPCLIRLEVLCYSSDIFNGLKPKVYLSFNVNTLRMLTAEPTATSIHLLIAYENIDAQECKFRKFNPCPVSAAFLYRSYDR